MREQYLQKALELTELIETTANGLMNVSLGLEDTKASVVFIEAGIMQDIAAETDDKGKAVFSNETARAAELVIRKRDNALIKEGSDLIHKHTITKNELANLLDKYRNQLAIYKAFLAGGAA